MATHSSSCYLDTNCLIYFVLRDSPLHPKGLSVITSIVSSGFNIYISPLCIDEFLYNLPGTLKQKRLDLKAVLSLPKLKVTNPPDDIKSQLKIPRLMSKFHLGPRDSYHLLTCLYRKIKYFATFDHDFDWVFSSNRLTHF